MKTRRQIPGVLHNLLETFTSRYSDYDGYWLFGQLLLEAETLSIDLRDEEKNSASSAVAAAACREAYTKFEDQMKKADMPIECIASAILTMTKAKTEKVGVVNHQPSSGYEVSFAVEAISDQGKKYRAEKTVFVAPHDPSIESRSNRSA
jgi:hypothetical protein